MFWRCGFPHKGGERTELHVLKKKKKKLILFINLNIKCSSDLLKLANFDDFLYSI
jgi:hypothetical protein